MERAAELVSEQLAITADLGWNLFEGSPDATLIVSETGRIVAANYQATLLTQYPASRLVGMSVDSLLPEDARNRHAHNRSGFFDDPRPRPMGVGLDLRLLRRNGQTLPVDVSLGPVSLEWGAVVIATIRRRTRAVE